MTYMSYALVNFSQLNQYFLLTIPAEINGVICSGQPNTIHPLVFTMVCDSGLLLQTPLPLSLESLHIRQEPQRLTRETPD